MVAYLQHNKYRTTVTNIEPHPIWPVFNAHQVHAFASVDFQIYFNFTKEFLPPVCEPDWGFPAAPALHSSRRRANCGVAAGAGPSFQSSILTANGRVVNCWVLWGADCGVGVLVRPLRRCFVRHGAWRAEPRWRRFDYCLRLGIVIARF